MTQTNFKGSDECQRKTRNTASSRIRRIYGIFLSAVVVIVAVCFAVSCVNIYNSGTDTPFTKESISAHFDMIAIPTYVCIGAIILGALISVFLPDESHELGKIYNPYIPLRSLSSRLNLSECDSEIAADIRQERKLRRSTIELCSFICILLLGGALIFALDFSRYTATDINAEILGCVVISLPLSLGALLLIFAGSLINSASATRELDLTKWAISRRKEALGEKKARKVAKGGNALLNAFRIVILAAGITFVILGINNGGMEQVLGKAVRICTECIGLG